MKRPRGGGDPAHQRVAVPARGDRHHAGRRALAAICDRAVGAPVVGDDRPRPRSRARARPSCALPMQVASVSASLRHGITTDTSMPPSGSARSRTGSRSVIAGDDSIASVRPARRRSLSAVASGGPEALRNRAPSPVRRPTRQEGWSDRLPGRRQGAG